MRRAVHNFRNYLNAITDGSSPTGTKLLEPKESSGDNQIDAHAVMAIVYGVAFLFALTICFVAKVMKPTGPKASDESSTGKASPA